MIHTFDYESYKVYASPVITGHSDAYLSDVVVHDTVDNSYMNHIEAWFKSSESAGLVFETFLSMGYTYQKTYPADSAIETFRKIYNFDPCDDSETSESETSESEENEGYIYLVFIPITERIGEDSQGNHYQVRGIH